MARPVPFTLPQEVVDAARKTRESEALSTITQNIDSTLSQGFSGLQGMAKQAAEPLQHFAQSVSSGGISVPTLEDLTPDWVKREQQRATEAVQRITSGTLGVSVPSLDDLTPASMRRGAAPQISASPTSSVELTGPLAAGTGTGLAGARTAPTGPPAASTGTPGAAGEIEAYIRSSAARRGIDPDVAVRVAQSEGGLSDPVRQSDVVYQGQREQSYGPLQLNVNGGVGSAALKAGIDPRNPAQWRQAVDFGLDEVARSGWGQWHGAARVGIGNRQGVGTYRGPVPGAPSATQAAWPPQAPSAPAPPPGTYAAEQLAPNQISEGAAQGLTSAEALAVCGPAAAVAFARANGRNPTLREAKELGQSLGVWNVDQGMAGPASEVTLLQKMGVPSRLQQGADERTIAGEVQQGRPVIIDTPGHYYVASGYDPASRTFEFGQTAAVLRASGGRTRYRLDELSTLGMGAPRATILMGAGG